MAQGVLHIEDEFVGRPLCGVDHKYPLSTIPVNDEKDIQDHRKKMRDWGAVPLCHRCIRTWRKAMES